MFCKFTPMTVYTGMSVRVFVCSVGCVARNDGIGGDRCECAGVKDWNVSVEQ